MRSPPLTIGVEEEYQVVDLETRALRPCITRLLRERHVGETGVRAELHQSTVEVGTDVCRTPAEIRDEVVRLRRYVADLVADDGLGIVAAGSHPFASWTESPITPMERYLGLEEGLQDVARRNLIFGTHVHVGIGDESFLVDAMRAARYFLPHLLALSVSSPFWMGRNTGLKSYRTSVWRTFPRTGVPPAFRSWADYTDVVRTLVGGRSMDDPTMIWWDIRPSHFHPTLEFRVCDMCTRVEEVVCISALIQALVAKLWRLRRDNLTIKDHAFTLLAENKFRAARYGLDGKLIDLRTGLEVPTRAMIADFVRDFLGDVLDELGTRREAEYAFRILEEGSSAHRQVGVFEETGDLRAVVDHLVGETLAGVD